MDENTQATSPATETSGSAPKVTGQEGSGSLLTGQSIETATPASSAPAASDGKASGSEGNANAQPVQLPGFAAAATKELKADEKFANLVSKYKSFDDFARAHLELEQAKGTTVRIPDASASDEDKAAFWAKLGVPDKPEAYALEQPELPAGLTYDQGYTDAYRQKAAELHLTADQAKILYQWANEQTASSFTAEMKRQEEAALVAKADAKRAVDETVRSLKAEWGSAFDTELAHTTRFVADMDAKVPGLKADLDRTGFGNSKSGIMLLNMLARQFADAKMVEGESSGLLVDAANAMFGASMKSK
jgi:hypothetical protein